MKIAILCGSGQFGGAERSVLDLIWSVRRTQPEADVCLVVPADGPVAEQAAMAGVKVRVLPYPARIAQLGEHGTSERMQGGTATGTSRLLIEMCLAGGDIWKYVRELTRTLREVNPDVVHSHALKMHVLGALARPAAAALVWHFHEGVRGRPLLRRFFHRAWRIADASVAVSQAVATDISDSTKGRLIPTVILNGIDLDRFAPTGHHLDLDHLAGLAPADAGTVRMGLVGTTGRFKGQDVFLRAVARLERSIPFRAYLVGGPLYVTNSSQVSLAELRSLSATLGLEDRVGFTGFVDDVPSAMRALDIVVHATTKPEPFGLVVAEAMACGRAVVASDAGGVSEITESGVTALLHAPGDVDGLTIVLTRLLSDAALRVRLAAAGLAFARAHLDRTRLGAEMLPVYRDARAHRLSRGD